MVGVVAGQRVGREHELSKGLRVGIEKGLLAKDSAVSPTDKDRELLVTSSMLHQPFTVSIPAGMEARFGGGTKISKTTEFALYATDPRRDGRITYVILEVDLKPIDLADHAQAVLNGYRRDLPGREFEELGGPITTEFGDRPAVQRDASFLPDDGRRVRYRVVVTVVGDQPVLVQLTAPETQFAAQEARFAKFLASARGN